jgi:retron-type reverse transcriptase
LPKTYGGLYPAVYGFQTLLSAFRLASKGKRESGEVLNFSRKLEENLIILQNELIWHTWTPGPYRRFVVREPKRREISAPIFRDRVVHHALVSVIEPLFDRKMIPRSFACRKGKGTHAAVEAARSYIRECHAKWGNFYVLKCDISKYFPSIYHERLKEIVHRTVRCKDTLWLIDRVIASGDEGDETAVGVPIGALTSQLFANIYLDTLDHHVKERLREPYYLRYMDDFVFFSRDKAHLQELKEEVTRFLTEELALSLNPKSGIFPWRHGLNFCGYRTWPTHTLPRRANVYRMQRRLRKMTKLQDAGKITKETVTQVLMSWFGYMRHCDSYKTRKEFLKKFYMRR